MSDWFLFPNKPVRVASIETFFSAIKGRERDWVLQSKHDGDRAVITMDGEGVVSIFSRHGRLLTDGEPWGHLRKLPIKAPWTLDAELVTEKLIVVWDFGYESGRLVAGLPYESRLDRVLSMPDLSSLGGHTIRPVKTFPAHIRNIERLLNGERVEGVVAKKLTATDLWGITGTRDTASQVKWIKNCS